MTSDHWERTERLSLSSGKPTSVGTEAHDYGDAYYADYGRIDQPYDWASQHWRTFFTMVAERVRAVTNPSSVLDVGCAKGLLVQAFCEQDVDAYGIDVSQYAIENAHPDVAARLSVGSAENVEGSWDLITCTEVLEHMAPANAERAIDSMCAASDRVLLSSTPSHFEEPTHINVREPAAWAASFAERGFFRRTDVDLSFLAPWAVLFEREDATRRDLAYRYERYAYPLHVEVLEKRAALRDAHRKLKEPGDLQRQLDELRHQLLTSRDHAIGVEAEAAQWRLRFERVAAELVEARDELVATHHHLAETLDQLKRIYASGTWRVGKAIVHPVAAFRRRLR
jgi:SAM-dependent methyltransferase